MTIGQKIKHFRTKKGISQETFAASLGISLQGYNKIETNKTRVDIERLQQIAETLDTNLVELLSYGENNIYYIHTINRENANKNLGLNTGTIIHNDLPQEYLASLEKVKLLEQENSFLKEKIKDLEKIISLMETKQV